MSVLFFGLMAQWLEQLPHKEKVIGSNPVKTTITPITQFGRVLVLHTRSYRFKSYSEYKYISGHGDQMDSKPIGQSSILWRCANGKVLKTTLIKPFSGNSSNIISYFGKNKSHKFEMLVRLQPLPQTTMVKYDLLRE